MYLSEMSCTEKFPDGSASYKHGATLHIECLTSVMASKPEEQETHLHLACSLIMVAIVSQLDFNNSSFSGSYKWATTS